MTSLSAGAESLDTSLPTQLAEAPDVALSLASKAIIKKRNQLLSLQWGRAIASLLVLCFHTGHAIAADKYFGIAEFKYPFKYGHAGVHYFFVLSGFLIISIHWKDLNKPSQLWRYLYKRAVRIYPPYWVIFVGVACFALLIPSSRYAIPSDPRILGLAMLLIPLDAESVGGSGAPVLGVAWTLQYEVLFYALVAMAIGGWRLVMIALIGAATLAYATPSYFEFLVEFILSHWMMLFALGVLGAIGCIKFDIPRPGFVAVVGGILFAATCASEVVLGRRSIGLIGDACYGIGSLLIICGTVKLEQAAHRFPKLPRLTYLGEASYSLYLIHYPLISVLCKIATLVLPINVWTALLAFLVINTACIVIAIAFHRFVEAPLLARLSK